MSDLKEYIKDRKKKDREFAYLYEEGYSDFKIGVLLQQERERMPMAPSLRLSLKRLKN